MCFRVELLLRLCLATFVSVFRLNGPLKSVLCPDRPVVIPVMLLLLMACPVFAGESSTDLHTGRALTQALEQRRALTVQAMPLRQLLTDLQQQTEICIVLDRRIDPSQRLTLTTELMPTLRVLQQVAAAVPDADVSVNRSFVLIGPESAAQRLRTLCERNRAMILEARREFDQDVYEQLSLRKRFSWDELSHPRDLLRQLAEGRRLTIRGADLVPHDLWHAGQWPAMTFAEAATLLLSQFDLTYRIDVATAALEIALIPDVVAIAQSHRVPRRWQESDRRRLAAQFPDLNFEWNRSSVSVAATYEQQQHIASMLSGDAMRGAAVTDSLKTRLFTLTLPDGISWRLLIEQLRQSGVPLRVEGNLESQLDESVAVSLTRMAGAEFFPRLFADLPVHVDVLDSEVVLHVKTPGE